MTENQETLLFYLPSLAIQHDAESMNMMGKAVPQEKD